MAMLSEDIRILYRAFGHSDLPYKEIASRARYQRAVLKWPLLSRLQHVESSTDSQPGAIAAADNPAKDLD